MSLLQADGVVAGYVPGVDIVCGCSLSVEAGELVGVIGPNGAGKSTLLKAIFGLLDLREGAVRLRGADVSSLPAHERVRAGMGYVPQVCNVFPHLTVLENLEMGAYPDPDKMRSRLGPLMELFPIIAERSGQRAGALSGGQRQMLGLARALVLEPDVLLLDEPSAGLAPAAKDLVFERIAEINAAGTAIVMVEQNARRCLQISHRAVVLDQGRNAHEGTGAALLDDPKVVELYLGSLGR